MTTYINLFGGPSTGKSTIASGLFYQLKLDGVNCEYIQEYAKDKTWGEDFETLKCQPYVTAKQFYRLFRVMDKVEYAITDSPLLTGLVYQGFGCNEYWEKWLLEAFADFNNINIFLVRTNRKYNKAGRNQTEEEACLIDETVRNLLDINFIKYHIVTADKHAVSKIIEILNNYSCSNISSSVSK